MAGSPVFRRIRREILARVAAVPAGRVLEASELASALNLPPRHVAHILSRLSPEEREHLPWHRVVPRDGLFPPPGKRDDAHHLQRDRLSREGVTLDGTGRIAGLADLRVNLPDDHRATIWADEEA